MPSGALLGSCCSCCSVSCWYLKWTTGFPMAPHATTLAADLAPYQEPLRFPWASHGLDFASPLGRCWGHRVVVVLFLAGPPQTVDLVPKMNHWISHGTQRSPPWRLSIDFCNCVCDYVAPKRRRHRELKGVTKSELNLLKYIAA